MTARVRVGAGIDNVAGVKLPVFTYFETGAATDNASLGLVGGGKKIQSVRQKYSVLLQNLIKLASPALKSTAIAILSIGAALLQSNSTAAPCKAVRSCFFFD